MKQIKFLYDVGTCFTEDNRNISIIEKKTQDVTRENKKCKIGYSTHHQKMYRYKCKICGWDNGWINEDNLKKGKGCSCCAGLTVVVGINDIPTTVPWMVKYFQGGYEEAVNYTSNSGRSFCPKCPFCEKVKKRKITPNQLKRNHSIGCTCSDGKSYPEKYISNLLDQLKIKYITQLNKTYFDWCDKYLYDFYLVDYNIIIEAHGMQHYEESYFTRSLHKEKCNDDTKKMLALNNGISSYVVLDCRYSKSEYILQSIKGSKISTLFKLDMVNFNKCDEFATSNLCKEVCLYFNNNEVSVGQLANIYRLSRKTVARYLKQGCKFHWCDYVGMNDKQKFEARKQLVSRVIKMKNDNPFISSIELSNIFNVSQDTILNYLREGVSLGLCTYDTEILKGHNQSIRTAASVKSTSKKINMFDFNHDYIATYNSQRELERNSIKDFGVILHSRNISDVCTGRTAQYKGYFFEFVSDKLINEEIKV